MSPHASPASPHWTPLVAVSSAHGVSMPLGRNPLYPSKLVTVERSTEPTACGAADIDGLTWTKLPQSCALRIRQAKGSTLAFIGFRDQVCSAQTPRARSAPPHHRKQHGAQPRTRATVQHMWLSVNALLLLKSSLVLRDACDDSDTLLIMRSAAASQDLPKISSIASGSFEKEVKVRDVDQHEGW